MDNSPEFNPSDFQPLASGLSDEDIGELLKLIRTRTDEKIIEIRSKREDAEVTTGFLADGEAGEGQTFDCVRTKQGWVIKTAKHWIA
jgi:hypothetical protein